MIKYQSRLYAPHPTNPRLPNYRGTPLVYYVLLFEFLHCCTVFVEHDESVINSIAKGLHGWEVLAKVEVLDGAVRAGRLLYEGVFTPCCEPEMFQQRESFRIRQ